MAKFINSTSKIPSFKDLDFNRSAKLFGQRFILEASLQRMRDAAYVPQLTDPLELGVEIKAFFDFFTQMQTLRKSRLDGKDRWLDVLVDSEPQEFEGNYLQVLFNMVGATYQESMIGPFLSIDLNYGDVFYNSSEDNTEFFTKIKNHVLQKDSFGLTPSSYKGGGFSGHLVNPRFVKKLELGNKEVLFPESFFEGDSEFDPDFDTTLRHLLDIFMVPYGLENRAEFEKFVDKHRNPSAYDGENAKYEIPFVANMIISYNDKEYHIKNMPFLLKIEHDLKFDFEDHDFYFFNAFDPTALDVHLSYACEEIALGLICQALFHKEAST